MKELPIVPGCRAVITKAVGKYDHRGREVHIAHERAPWPGGTCGRCGRSTVWDIFGPEDIKQAAGAICECVLMRIDGHEPDAFDEQAYKTTPTNMPVEAVK